MSDKLKIEWIEKLWMDRRTRVKMKHSLKTMFYFACKEAEKRGKNETLKELDPNAELYLILGYLEAGDHSPIIVKAIQGLVERYEILTGINELRLQKDQVISKKDKSPTQEKKQ